MLSKSLLNELKIIINEDYGKELDDIEINQIANNLVAYFDLLSKINFKIKNEVKSPDLLLIKK
ncbi:MAG: hypothetical protein WC303_02930 [Candidatus Paceibacterota bacterium]|jgi:hypothetical protein